MIAFVFDNVAEMADVIGSLSTLALALVVYSWTRRTDRLESSRQIQNEWQTYNITVTSNPHLFRQDIKLHPFGELSEDDHYKLYLHFLSMNVVLNVWLLEKEGFVDKKTSRSTMINQANQLYNSRDFVAKHVFPRGYPLEFQSIVHGMWGEIDANGGGPLAME